MSDNFMPFGEFVEIQPRVVLEKSKEYDFVAMEDLQPNQRAIDIVSRRVWSGSGGARFQDADTLFARITPCLENGKTAFISGLESGAGFGSTEFYVFRARRRVSDAQYIYYLARSEIIREPAIKSMVGSSGRQRVKKEALENIKVRRIAVSTQVAIADILSAYDDLIENNRRRIALLEEAARLLYREWFVHFRFPGHEHVKVVDGLPEGWEQRTLGDVAQINRESYRARELPEQINYIDIASVSRGRIQGANVMSAAEAPGRARRKVQDGDSIWSNVRPNLRAYALILSPGELDVVSTGFTVLTPSTVPFTWLYLLVTTDHFVGHLVNHATGAGYPAVRPDDFERAEIILPPSRLLDHFHQAIEPNFRQIRTLGQQNQKLAQARDLLLPRLMSGEIPV